MLQFRAIAAVIRGPRWGGAWEWRVAWGENRRRVDRRARAGSGIAPRQLGRAFLVTVLLAAGLWGGVVGYRALVRTHALALRTIRFTGLSRATADELLALSPVKPGDNLLTADLSALEAALLRHPWVRAVEVRRRFPPSLEVKVTERSAAALVDLSGLYLVDEDGNVFKRAAHGDGLDLPVVTGLSRADYLQHPSLVRPLLAGALALARSWRADGWDGEEPIAEIHLDPDGTTLYLGPDGTEARLGSGELRQKLTRLEEVLTALRADGKKADVLHLDNRLHPSSVAVELARKEGRDGG
jgi:cell division protein FtsQ